MAWATRTAASRSSRPAVVCSDRIWGVEQHRPHLIGRIVRTEGPADIGDPGSLGAAATDILGNADAELRVAGVSSMRQKRVTEAAEVRARSASSVIDRLSGALGSSMRTAAIFAIVAGI